MNEETARIIWEAMTQEQRDKLIVSTQEVAKALQELSDKICA